MGAIFAALARAVPILFTPRIVGLAFLPLVIAAIVWTAIAVATWHPFTAWLVSIVGASPDSLWPAIGAGVVRFARYAPAGSRGVGLARAHGYGMRFQEYLEAANDRGLVAENPGAVRSGGRTR